MIQNGFFFLKSEEYPYQNIAKATATHFGTAVCSNGHVAPRLSRSKIESLQQQKKTEKSERQRLTAKDLAQGEKLFPLPSNVCLASTRDNNATILQNFPDQDESHATIRSYVQCNFELFFVPSLSALIWYRKLWPQH